MNFKGFDDYIEIFKGGTQTDSTGREHDGDRLIDKALATFNAAEHEPPAVIGHPSETAPAYAWVAGLKDEVKNGTRVLLAKFRDVVPEFEAMVARGLFKKRSASFYPDGRLRHVGFLGAMPPAVKGLADIGFLADEDCFEFVEEWKLASIGQILGRLRDFLIEKFGMEAADRVVAPWAIDDIRQPESEPAGFSAGAQPKGGKAMEFTQEELEAKLAAAREEERQKVAEEAAEKEREKRFSQDLAGVQAFCDRMVQEGRIAPAWIDSGLKTFMESLAGAEPVTFSEGNQATPLDWLKDFFEHQMPKLVDFREVAGRDKDLPDIEPEFAECGDEERLDLHRKITALAAKEKISYAEAADRLAD